MNFFSKRAFSALAPLKKAEINLTSLSLTGRDLLAPNNFTSDEIKSVLWTAIDVKYNVKNNRRNCLPKLENARLSLLLEKPRLITQFSVQNACQLLNVSVNTMTNIKYGNDAEDYGHLLDTFSDIILCQDSSQSTIESIADGANAPVIATESHEHSLINVFSHLMTVYEHYNHLKGLKFSWVGTQSPVINSYLCLLPRLGIDIKYFCVDEKGDCASPKLLSDAKKICRSCETEIHACGSVEQAIQRCDVISTNSHSKNDLKITEKMLRIAKPDWILLDSFPRGAEVDENIYRHKNSLVWSSFANLQWIYAGLIIRMLKNYEYSTERPTFDDIGDKWVDEGKS